MLGLMIGTTLMATATTIFLLYNASIENQKANLLEMSQSQARLIISVANHLIERNHATDHDDIPLTGPLTAEDIVHFLKKSHADQPGFGATGEFVLGYEKDNYIRFPLPARHITGGQIDPIKIGGTKAEPMRRGLKGQTGVIIGPDYRGEIVIAGYSPLPKMGYALVAKKDLSELRKPFIHAGVIAFAGVLFIFALTIPIFHCIGSPLVDQLENLVKTRTAQLNLANAKLVTLTRQDPLTGLANRNVLDEAVDHSIKQARRNKGLSALAFIDLNDFKEVNDSYGHEVGDRLLCEVAKRLQSKVREVDTVIRYGGDEFIIVLHEISDQTAAQTIAEKIQEAIRQPFNLGAIKGVSVSASLGMTIIDDHATSVDDVLKQADMAMYAAKNSNKIYVNHL